MITANGVKIFQKYNGEEDSFARSATKSEREQLSDKDWALIDQLLPRIAIARDGQAAKEYEVDTENLLAASCANQEVVSLLRSLCDKLMPPKF